MLNYGEELVYWYLRFNGFFLIDNFVLHASPTTVTKTSDSDLLGIRLPHVYEEIGGQETDWDANCLFRELDKDKPIALICEVKTGGFSSEKLFNPLHIEKAVARLGISSNYKEFVQQIQSDAITQVADYQEAKILFTRKKENPRNDCLHIKLIDVDKFIKRRLKKYIDRKYNDRMFFPSPLLQYLAWQEHRNL